MTKNEAKKIIEYVFTHKFDEGYFQKFISNIFKEYKPLSKIYEGHYIKHAFKPQVAKYKVMGSFSDDEGNDVDILLVALNNINTLQRSRSLQRNFVADYLNTNNKEAAIVAFVTNKDEWRFSLVKLDHSLRIVEDKLKTEKEVTPARRWSFLVGKNEGSHTAQSRFIKLLTSDEKPNLAELESAFDIESVTKEFFDKYKELFFGLQEYLESLIKSDEAIKKDFLDKNISTSDFAKKTLGQIVFLYFLQKKGWFGVASDKDWGTGPKNFLREIFNRREKYGENFFNDILEPLFYEGLAQDRGESAIYTRLNNVRMPFLNGGLFEPMNNYKWEETDMIIPDELFSNDVVNTKTGDIGNGILDVFDRYNFTVNENEPLEQEVAVDPEMLGKVFENLLDIKDRKSNGAFYTPREIVHYMCQETLINYLETETENIDKSDIEFFIRQGELILENDKTTADKIVEKEDRGYKYKGEYTYLLPQSIIGNALLIDKLLYNIKVADPAVGSGAFPLGMLNEIVRARRVIGVHTKENKKVYTLKKETISNSLYGVDLDPGAVEIAKLRLWLSLVVDENTPHPLPNLDHKIMQGNSLISEYEGIRLFDDSIFSADHNKVEENKEVHGRLKEIGEETIALANQNIFSGEKLEALKKEAKFLNKELKKNRLDNTQAPESRSLFDEPEQISILEEKTKELTEKTKLYIDESQRSCKEELKRDIDELKWDIIEMTLRQQGQEDKIEDLQKLRKKNIKPFFIWKLEFADVFKEKGGFDVVIGNPPYIQLQKDGGILADMFQDSGYETFVRSGDIYALFYEHGNNILNDHGHLAFITSNKWMRAGYGEKLRKYLSETTTPKLLVDLGSGIFETATVDTNILLFQKNKRKINCKACSVKIDLVEENIFLQNYIQENSVKLNNFSSTAWIVMDEKELMIKDKIESIGVPLSKWDIQINRGILTGYNEAFIIDQKKYDELISIDPKSSEIIKPILRGRDIYKYYSEWANLYLINTHNGISSKNIEQIDVENYPAVKEYLDAYMERLLKRGDKGKTPYNLRNCAFLEDINKDKILYSEIVREPQFFLDVKGVYPEASAFLMTGSDNLRFLVSILNSKPFTYFFSRFYAGGGLGDTGYRYKKKFLELTPVPKISKADQDPFIDLVNQILEITSANEYDPKNPPERQKQIETKIDELVMDLYELTEEEKEIVRNN